MLDGLLTEWGIAQEAGGGDGAGRGSRHAIQVQIGCVFAETGGHADVVDAHEAAAGERQIHRVFRVRRQSGRERE